MMSMVHFGEAMINLMQFSLVISHCNRPIKLTFWCFDSDGKNTLDNVFKILFQNTALKCI